MMRIKKVIAHQRKEGMQRVIRAKKGVRK